MKKILILGCGGTIAMVPDPKSGVLKPAKTVEDIATLVPTLKESADITLEQLLNIDSTNMNPGHWAKISMVLAERVCQYDGIIVTHGTDTMAYTATAVSMAIGNNPPTPIVFTGSQLPLVAFGTDARFNLENAMKTVIEAARLSVNEVMIVFHDRVLRGTRTIKTSEAKFTAFDSPAFDELAQINAIGVAFNQQVHKKTAESKIVLKPHFQRGILTVDLVPGIEPSILSAVMDSGTCQGLLLKSLGSGNVPSLDDFSIIPIIKKAASLSIPVLVSTKFVGGNTHMNTYEPGKEALAAGAIGTLDMTDVAAQVKLMWALAQGYRSPEALKAIIETSLVGEVTAPEAAEVSPLINTVVGGSFKM
ncbi:MAG: asparaginase [Candidatus Paceibacterota bacterium]|jgi:L-asparaginase